MIAKIDSISSVSSTRPSYKANSQKSVATTPNYATNSTNLLGATSVSAFQALNGIKTASTLNFGAAAEIPLTPTERSIIGESEIRIANLLDIEPGDDINLPRKKMPEASKKFNPAGLDVVSNEINGIRSYGITNDFGDNILLAKIDMAKGKENLPTITYKQGKFMPEVTVKDPSLGGKSIKMYAGSRLRGDGFELVMPGKFLPTKGKKYQTIRYNSPSFTGNVAITTMNKEDRTVHAVDLYMNSTFPQEAIRGDFADEFEKFDPTVVIPAGGFGERFRNISRDVENKPSSKLPTDQNYRVIGTTLNMAAAAGAIKGDKTDKLTYISQNHEIPQNDKTVYVGKYGTDGGAISEALFRNIISNDKDVVILNADIFTNADITRTYNALKTLPDAALVIPYYPVNPDRAKSFGLLGIEQDENNNMQIKAFIEKPDYTKIPPDPNKFKNRGEYDIAMDAWETVQTAAHPSEKDVYLANPGMYFMTSQAAKVLMAEGIIDDKETGLGKSVMPKIVELANQGKLKDESGRPLKVYTVPLEAKGGKPAVWDDIGTAEAYLSLVKDVAYETRTHGTTPDNKYYGVPERVLNDFKNNTNSKTGIVFDSKEARQSFAAFKTKYNVQEAIGNMFIAGNQSAS